MARNGNSKAALAAAEAAFEADSGMGFEEVDKDDFQIPFVRILQALSPQLKKSDASYIEGASQGDIFNTVTHQVWDSEEGIVVLPVYYQKKYLEFIPRAQGGGFVQELPRTDEVLSAARDWTLLSNGNEVVETHQHWVKIVHDDGSLETALIDMKKTQLRQSKTWNSLIGGQFYKGTLAPRWSATYLLTSREDGNDKGSWHSWVVKIKDQLPIEEYLTSPLVSSAKELHGTLTKGALKIAAPTPEAITNQVLTLDDDVPF